MANNRGSGPGSLGTWALVLGLVIFVGGLYYALQQHEAKMAEIERRNKEEEARLAAEAAKDPNEELARKNPRLALDSAIKLFSGAEGKVDERQARALFLASANQEFALARAWTAALTAHGLCSFERGREKAVQALGVALSEVEKLAASGDSDAMVALGWLAEAGVGMEASPEKALQWFRRAGDERGNTTGKVELARMRRKGLGGAEPDIHEAFKLLEEAAGQYDIRAVCALGMMYRDGVGVEESQTEAVSRFRQAADVGSPEGLNLLARACFEGAGLRRDYKRALQLARQAVDQEYAPARATMGWAYKNGYGVTANGEQAVIWYKQAAEKGDLDAMMELGTMLVNGGDGVKRDREEGLRWLKRSAEEGSAAGQALLDAAMAVPKADDAPPGEGEPAPASE